MNDASRATLALTLSLVAGCFDFGRPAPARPIDCAVERAAERFPDVCGADASVDDGGPEDAATD